MTCSDPPTSAANQPRTSRGLLVEQLISANLRLFAAHRDSYGNSYDLIPLLDELVPLVEQLQAAPVPDPRPIIHLDVDVVPVERGPVQTGTDCCLTMAFRATPVLTVDDGEVDPFTGEEVGWPFPRIYWSNGVVTDGLVEPAGKS